MIAIARSPPHAGPGVVRFLKGQPAKFGTSFDKRTRWTCGAGPVIKGVTVHRRISRSLGLAAAVGLLAAALPTAAYAGGPRTRELELRDNCEATTFNAAFGPGFCTKTDGEVTADKFTAALAKGGHGAWWIRQRDITLDAGDGIKATNVGGIAHTFTEVAAYGKGCVAPFNVAVSETVDNCDFGKVGATFVPQGATSAAQVLAVGTHRFQCLFHPWMRTTVTVRKS
jgi:plastocyanin